MLSSKRKDKIYEEEKFRIEIKNLLEKNNKTTKNKAFEFLNSNLGIFLLSTFFISFLSWSYTQYETHAYEKRKKAERIEVLSTEIKKRTSIIKSSINQRLTYDNLRQLEVVFTGNIKMVMDYGGQIENNNYFTNSHFKYIGMEELLTELEHLHALPKNKKTKVAYDDLYKLYLNLKNKSHQIVKTRGDAWNENNVVELDKAEKNKLKKDIEPYLLK